MYTTLTRSALLHLLVRAAERGPAGERVQHGRTLLGDHRLLSFVRGLSLGALIGAAIAGSTFWGRLRARRHG